MAHNAPSALVTDEGKVLFRIDGRFFELTQPDLRSLLGLADGPIGLGITIDDNNFYFEVAGSDEIKKVTARRLSGLLAQASATG